MPDPILWSSAWPHFLAALAGGYLLGSIPFGLVLTRLAGLGDIRSIGSGNIGATNVLRTGRKGLAAATLILDGAKGAVAVLIAGLWGADTALMAGYGAILGHLFPVWLRFNGGKGVATTLGILLALSWPIGVAACLTWLIVAAVLRYSSLAALLAVAFAPAYAWYLPPLWGESSDPRIVWFSAVLAILVWTKHHTNIRRLLRGEEPRIGQRKAEAAH
jgi:acyl phosphate:glycerol-3-phosphate acyltransferase